MKACFHVGRKSAIITIIKYIVLSGHALVALYPFVWVLLSSFKTDNEIYSNSFGFPAELQFSNYTEAFLGAQVLSNFLNSLLYAFVTVFFVLLFSSMTSYALVRVFPSRKLHMYFTMGIMIPIHAVIIPLVIFLRNMNLINTREGIVLAYIVSNLSFSIFVLVAFMKTLPKELEDAAMIDGCKRYRLFFSIVIPISKAGLATVGTFSFLNVWNDLLLALVITSSPSLRTLNLGCFNLRAQYSQRYALISAGLIILIVPVAIMYIIFQEQIVKGMTAGAIKG